MLIRAFQFTPALALIIAALVSAAAAQDYLRPKDDAIACEQRSDWNKLVRMFERGNRGATERFLLHRPQGHACMKLPFSRPLYVQIRSTDDVVCVRPMGELRCLWTSMQFLR